MQVYKKNKGFTLIELMIVITIIGVLAAVAVPVYQDYTIRTRVAECTSLFGPIKTAATLHVSDQGTLPSALGSLSGISTTATEHSGVYVEWIDIGATPGSGTDVVCHLRDQGNLGTARDRSLVLTPTLPPGGGRIQWTIDTTNTNIPEEYLPSL